MPLLGTFGSNSVKSIRSKIMIVQVFDINLTLTGNSGSPYHTFVQNNINGSYIPTNVSWYPVGSGSLYGFSVPAATEIPFTVRQASGSGGNGGSTSGNIYQITGTLNIPKDSWIFLASGNSGYGPTSSGAGDGNSGGGGGATQILVSQSGGPYTVNGISLTTALVANGAGGGNDRNYQGFNGQGPSYSSLTASTNWGIYSNNGNTYSRSGTTYGGFPNGGATDDATASGGGPGTNYFNSNFVTGTNITFFASGTTSRFPGNPGFISLSNI